MVSIRMQGSLMLVVMLALFTFTVAGPQDDDPTATAGVWEEVKQLYELAKEAGEKVPADVYEWAKQDLESIGNWKYHIVELTSSDSSGIEERLNELGQDRWECIWVQSLGEKTRFIMKRPSRSYLSRIPLSQIMRLVPLMGSDTDGQ